MRRATSLLLAILVTACIGLAKQAREVEEGILGLERDALLRCMGPPRYMDAAEGRELWVYSQRLQGLYEEVEVYLAEGQGTQHQRPTVMQGTPSGETSKDTRRLNPVGGSVAPGQCRLAFEIQDGAVRAFNATGRGSTGMNEDAACAVMAHRCLPAPIASQ